MFDATGHGDPCELMTIGYEGSSIADFLATLKAAGVRTLIDVRELPLSRKKGFSKSALKDALAVHGIDYLHLRGLGDPKPGRDAARAGDMDRFREIFCDHMKTSAAETALEEAVIAVSKGGACLLCFERCHTDCHRAIVADEIAKKVRVQQKHIGVRKGIGLRVTG